MWDERRTDTCLRPIVLPYILIHQTCFPNTTVAEDDNLTFFSRSDNARIARSDLKKNFLSRRHFQGMYYRDLDFSVYLGCLMTILLFPDGF